MSSRSVLLLAEYRVARDPLVGTPYLRSQSLRAMSILLLDLECLSAEFTQLAHEAESSALDALPVFRNLAINTEDLDRFVSTAMS